MSRKEAGYAKERAQREAAARDKLRAAAAEAARREEAATIPAGHVRIVTWTPQYKRTVNGAWWYCNSSVDGRIVSEEALTAFSPGYTSHEITWPDGHREFCGFDSSLYATASGPRLSVLNRSTITLLPYQRRGVMRAVGNAALVDEWCASQECIDGALHSRYAQDFAWPRPTTLDRRILDHFNEQHPNL